MRSTFLIPVLVAVVAALPAPNPQEIDLDLIINVPTPTIIQATGTPDQIVTYDTKAILASATAASSISVDITDVATSTPSIVKRAACGPEPSGYGPVTSSPKDDAASFAANPVYANAANGAAVPSGYVQTFKNLNASSSAYGYMGRSNAIKGCMGINVYFERDPKNTPDKAACPNPASLTQIRCVYWGGPVTAGNTNNYGRKWEQFSVVFAGSNGYVNQNIAAPSGYSDATYLNNAAINAPYDTLGYNTYMGAKVFATGPFNATLCAEACNAQNIYNIVNPPADGAPVQTCQFFNTYLLFLNNTQALGQYCAMYSSAWTSKYATKVEQWSGNDRYTVQFSYSFSNITNPGTTPNKAAAVAQAKEEIAYSTLQGYCSTLLAYNDLNAYVTATSTKIPVSTVTTTTTLKIKASSSSSSSSPSSSSSVKASSSSSSLKASSLSKRAVASAVSTPAGLTKYPANVLSVACSALVTSVPKTATVTVSTVTVTGATSRSTVIKTVTTTTR
ncbi:hypothetical protein D6D01_03050 [Aureobasidium pullulans]|uniref:Uncharacterized protein n=1 Tax=Aureobasidium pullulans TaxID=5580 RepID=A0A4S9LN85_AURPU|nr:hypothetical protein D6D01_03050 [Aureobasidium pullulans]